MVSFLADEETRADYRHHWPGRVVSGRMAARSRLRGVRTDPPSLRHQLLADRAPDRSSHADPRRPARSAVADSRARTRSAARGLQPRRDVVRAGLLGSADADRRVQLAGRDPRARGRARRRSDHSPLSGVVIRDVREGPRSAAARDDAVLPAESVRRVEGVRALHHGQLSRELRLVCRLRNPVQPRVAAARARVRDAESHRRRRPHQDRESQGTAASATATRIATGDSPATTCARCG